ncbi:MAG: hypothetical protein ACXWNK_00090 [Vulcanimicrobiaceae bacterium]
MPRQIIDTESSRPAYVRRQILTTVVLILVIALLLVAGYEVWEGKHAGPARVQPATATVGPARTGSPPGK